MLTFNLKDIKEVEIIGLRWFDKVNGNTYHSVQVIVNNEDCFYQGLTYGYDRAYEQTAKDIFIKRILNKRASNIINKSFRDLVSELSHKGIKIYSHHTDIKRKRDL